MKQDDDKGNSVFRTMTQLDDELIQEAMNNMTQAFDENSKKFGMEKLSFEAVEQWIYENREVPEFRDLQHPWDFSQRRTLPDSTHERIQRIRSVEKALQEVQRERSGETTRNEHEGDENSIWEVSWQRLRDNLSRRSQLLSMGTTC